VLRTLGEGLSTTEVPQFAPCPNQTSLQIVLLQRLHGRRSGSSEGLSNATPSHQLECTSMAAQNTAGVARCSRFKFLCLVCVCVLPIGCQRDDNYAPATFTKEWTATLDSTLATDRVQIVAVGSCSVWFLDARNNRLLRWTCEGEEETTIGQAGTEDGAFRQAALLATLGDTVAVWDILLQRLTLFSPDGALIGTKEHDVRRSVHGFVRAFRDSDFTTFCSEQYVGSMDVTSTGLLEWNKSKDGRWALYREWRGVPIHLIETASERIVIPTSPPLVPSCLYDKLARVVIARNTEPYVYISNGDAADTVQVPGMLAQDVTTPSIDDIVTTMSADSSASLQNLALRLIADGISAIAESHEVFYHLFALNSRGDEVWMLTGTPEGVRRQINTLSLSTGQMRVTTINVENGARILQMAIGPQHLYILEELLGEIRLTAHSSSTFR
jgi:hypothetical protein